MREIYICIYVCKSCEATYHVGSLQRMSSRCARKDRSRLSIEASGVLLIRASRRSASNIQLSTGCPRRVVPLSSPPRDSRQRRVIAALLPHVVHPRPPATAAPRRCSNCAIRTEIEPAIFRVMSSRRRTSRVVVGVEGRPLDLSPSASRRLPRSSSPRTRVSRFSFYLLNSSVMIA